MESNDPTVLLPENVENVMFHGNSIIWSIPNGIPCSIKMGPLFCWIVQFVFSCPSYLELLHAGRSLDCPEKERLKRNF